MSITWISTAMSLANLVICFLLKMTTEDGSMLVSMELRLWLLTIIVTVFYLITIKLRNAIQTTLELKQQQHHYHRIYHPCIRLETNLKKSLILTNQKEVMIRWSTFPTRTRRRERGRGEAEDAGAGEQQLPAEGQEDAADGHPLPINKIPCIIWQTPLFGLLSPTIATPDV